MTYTDEIIEAYSQSFPHHVMIDYTSKRNTQDILKWCSEKHGDNEWAYYAFIHTDTTVKGVFFFLTEQDLIWFKLRWI